MTPTDHAINRIHEYTGRGMAWGLAIFKAAEDTGTTRQAIVAELAHRRKVNKAKRDRWKKPVKHWQD